MGVLCLVLHFSWPSWLDFLVWPQAFLFTADLSGQHWVISWTWLFFFFLTLWDCSLRVRALPCQPGCHPCLPAWPLLWNSPLCFLTKTFRVRDPSLVPWDWRYFACTCSGILHPLMCSGTHMLHPPFEAQVFSTRHEMDLQSYLSSCLL